MGHIITLILDLLTHSTVPSWFSWHDCTQQREKCGMCKWFPLVLSIEMCGHLLTICICTCLVIQLQSVQWVCIALMCIGLIYSLHLCPGCCVCVSVCIKYSRANICTSMCNMTLVCAVQLPLQHVAWWVCGAGLCGQESSSCWAVWSASPEEGICGFDWPSCSGVTLEWTLHKVMCKRKLQLRRHRMYTMFKE